VCVCVCVCVCMCVRVHVRAHVCASSNFVCRQGEWADSLCCALGPGRAKERRFPSKTKITVHTFMWRAQDYIST